MTPIISTLSNLSLIHVLFYSYHSVITLVELLYFLKLSTLSTQKELMLGLSHSHLCYCYFGQISMQNNSLIVWANLNPKQITMLKACILQFSRMHSTTKLKNFELCCKTPWYDYLWPLKRIMYKTKGIKIQPNIINEDNRSIWCYMCSFVEILCELEGKLGLILGNSCMPSMLWIFCDSTLLWTSSIFFWIQ